MTIPLPATAPAPSSPAASATGRANRRTDTGPERRLRSALHARGLRFRKDHPVVVPGIRVRPDVVFVGKQVAVFTDGCFWHGCPEHFIAPRANAEFWRDKIAGNKRRDEKVDAALSNAGWSVFRYWEHVSPEHAAAEIAAHLRDRG